MSLDKKSQQSSFSSARESLDKVPDVWNRVVDNASLSCRFEADGCLYDLDLLRGHRFIYLNGTRRLGDGPVERPLNQSQSFLSLIVLKHEKAIQDCMIELTGLPSS